MKQAHSAMFSHQSPPTKMRLSLLIPTMQVPSEPPGGESDPHEEPEPAAVKGECSFAVCLSMLVLTTSVRRDAGMLHRFCVSNHCERQSG